MRLSRQHPPPAALPTAAPPCLLTPTPVCFRNAAMLTRAVKQVSAALGSAHPLVLKGKKDIKRLRRKGEEIRWRELTQWHSTKIDTALQAVEEGGEA